MSGIVDYQIKINGYKFQDSKVQKLKQRPKAEKTDSLLQSEYPDALLKECLHREGSTEGKTRRMVFDIRAIVVLAAATYVCAMIIPC